MLLLREIVVIIVQIILQFVNLPLCWFSRFVKFGIIKIFVITSAIVGIAGNVISYRLISTFEDKLLVVSCD